MENRSLNEFLNEEPRATEAEHDDTGGTITPATADVSETTVTAARPTMVWTPVGGECADCDETVQRRWRETAGDTERLVCLACKSWD